MRLITLEDCILDATFTSAKLTAQTSAILEENAEAFALSRKVSQNRARHEDIARCLASERKRLASAKQTRDSLRASLAARREAMAAGRVAQETGERYLADATEGLLRCRRDLASTREAMEAQRRRIVEDLARIYPIDPVHRDSSSSGSAAGGVSGGVGGGLNRMLAFEIRGAYLPSIGHEDADEAVTSAALGYVAHVVYILSFYLSVPLRYPVKFEGSRSFIKDPISVIQGARTFPLWSRGSPLYRFEYAIFLLNKDIEQVSAVQEPG